MKRCPRCGSEYPDEYQLCTRDSTPLTPVGFVPPPPQLQTPPIPNPPPGQGYSMPPMQGQNYGPPPPSRPANGWLLPLIIVGVLFLGLLAVAGVGLFWYFHNTPSTTVITHDDPSPSGGGKASSETPSSPGDSPQSALNTPSAPGGEKVITPAETPPKDDAAPLNHAEPAEEPNDVSKRLLTEADLEGKTAWELTLMRNEPYARHGYRLHLNQKVADYFRLQPWYHPDTDDMEKVKNRLTDVERKNTQFILDYQTRHHLLLK